MLDLDPADIDLMLDRTRPLWRDLAGQRVFVTGGTGFFGRWLLSCLIAANARCAAGVRAVVLTRDPPAFRRREPDLADAPGIALWPGDVRSFDFPAGAFSHVIHAATDVGTAVKPRRQVDSIVAGTARVLDFAVRAGAEGFLLTSSGAVYGPQPATLPRMPEDHPGAPDPADPRSAYGNAKRLAEQLGSLVHAETGLRATVARGYAFVGPGLALDAHFAIGNFIRDALERDAIQVGGDGTPVRSYLYAADLAVWLWTILLRGQARRAYNLGSDRGVTIAELAATVARTLAPAGGPEKPVRIAEAVREDGFRSVYLPDIGRARAELGLEPWTDLPTAIARTADWARRRPGRGA